MNFDCMRDKDLRKEAKKRGLKRYSSLNKAQLVQYLKTEVHPLQPGKLVSIQVRRQNLRLCQ